MGNELFLSNIQNLLRSNLTEWTSILQGYGVRLFMAMAVIALIVNIILIQTESAGGIDTNKILGFLVRFAFVTGFFYTLLINGVDYASNIIDSFIDVGKNAIGYKYDENTADKVLSAGFQIIESVERSKKIGMLKILTGIPLYFIAIIIFIILILILANYIVEMASAWIMIFGGYFVLAFGATQWTREWVINYFKAVFGIGLKILTLMFLINIGVDLIQKQVSILNGASFTINNGVAILATTILLYMVMNKVPDAVVSLVSGAWGHMSAINMASAVAALAGAAEALHTGISMMGRMGGFAFDGAKNFAAGARDKIREESLKRSGLDQNDTFSDWGNQQSSLFSNNNENRSGSGLAYNAGRAAGRMHSALRGKLYSDEDKEDTSYNNHPGDSSDNSNDKTGDTKDNPSNNDKNS